MVHLLTIVHRIGNKLDRKISVIQEHNLTLCMENFEENSVQIQPLQSKLDFHSN